MLFVKTFKGYEDRTGELDKAVNDWIRHHGAGIEIVDIKTVLAHEQAGRAKMGDLLYTVIYRAPAPVD